MKIILLSIVCLTAITGCGNQKLEKLKVRYDIEKNELDRLEKLQAEDLASHKVLLNKIDSAIRLDEMAGGSVDDDTHKMAEESRRKISELKSLNDSNVKKQKEKLDAVKRQLMEET